MKNFKHLFLVLFVFTQIFIAPKVYADDIPSVEEMLKVYTSADGSIAQIEVLVYNTQGGDDEYVNNVFIEYQLNGTGTWKRLLNIRAAGSGGAAPADAINISGGGFWLNPYLDSETEPSSINFTGPKGMIGNIAKGEVEGEDHYLHFDWVIPHDEAHIDQLINIRIKGSYHLDPWSGGNNAGNFGPSLANGSGEAVDIWGTYSPDLSSAITFYNFVSPMVPNNDYFYSFEHFTNDNPTAAGVFSIAALTIGDNQEKRRLWKIIQDENSVDSPEMHEDAEFDEREGWGDQDLSKIKFILGPGESTGVNIEYYTFTLNGIFKIDITPNDDITTTEIMPPSLVTATQESYSVKIVWEKGESKIPDDYLKYELYRRDADNSSTEYKKIYEQTLDDSDHMNYDYRNDEELTTQGYDFVERQYIDCFVNPGKNYQYQVKAIYTTGNNSISIPTVSDEIETLELPQLTGIYASDDECDKIQLSHNNSFGPGSETQLSNGFQLTDYKFQIRRKKKYLDTEPEDLAEPTSIFSNSDDLYADTHADNNELVIGQKYEYYIYTQALLSNSNSTISVIISNVNPAEVITGELLPDFSQIDNFNIVEGSDQQMIFTWELDAQHEFERLERLNGGVVEDVIDLGEVTYNVNGDNHTYSYNYTGFDNCTNYEYSISIHNCYAQTSESTERRTMNSTSQSISITPKTDSIFIADQKELKVSKGYFDNRVELQWENNKNSVIQSFKINRASYDISGQVSAWEVIGEVPNSVHHFTDIYTNANEFYKYKIVCAIPCETDTANNNTAQPIQSNEQIGFRYIDGRVIGTSSFENSQPVKSVKISSEVDNQKNRSKSIHTSFQLDTALFENPQKNYGVGFWVKKMDEESVQLFDISCWDDAITTHQYDSVDFNEWHYIFVELNHDDFSKVYIDGHCLTDDLPSCIRPEIVIGELDKDLYIDELSIWDSHPSVYDGKYFSSTETGLLAYFHCDEPLADSIGINPDPMYEKLFDYSRDKFGIANKNHLVIAGSTSAEIFPLAQKCYTHTDSLGHFDLQGIRINGLGSLVNITPSTEVIVQNEIITDPMHEFTPPFQPVFLGDGNSMQNFVDFTDISSFDISGSAFYLDPNKSSDSLCTDSDDDGIFSLNESNYLLDCDSYISKYELDSVSNVGVQGASVLVDGEVVYDLNGNQVYTDANGAFNVKVPIGRHQISIDKEGHTFVNQIWNSGDHSEIVLEPNTADAETRIVYNFTKNEFGLTFYDNTVRTLVGRVCGGTTQADRVFAKQASKNNIGTSSFVLKNVGTEIHSILVNTDQETGEYLVKLLPIQYQLKATALSGKTLKIDTHTEASKFFNDDTGNGQPFAFPTIDLTTKESYFNYGQAFYDNIVNIADLNVFGKATVADSTSVDSIQRISDEILFDYYELIDEPNSIYVNLNNQVYTQENLIDGAIVGEVIKDDFDNYPHLFGINHEMTKDSIIVLMTNPFDYDHSENFIYRVNPSVEYYTGLYNPEIDESSVPLPYLGEFNWEIINQVFNEDSQVWEDGEEKLIPNIFLDTNVDSLDYQFGSPIFKKNKKYIFVCKVQEVYYKYAEGEIIATDIVPVETGSISLNDGVLSNSYQVNSSSIQVPFIPLNVNTSLNGDDSFIQNFVLTYSEGVISVDSNKDYYVFGSRPDEGTTFFSTGPEVVEMILRDPPGDQSYSYIESGATSIQEVEVTSVGEAVSDHLEKDINLGTDMTFTLPFGGPAITTEIILNTQIDIEFESLIDTTENSIIENTFSVGYQTSAEEFNIGSGGDLFIAKNYNILYGTNKFLEIVDVALCSNQGVVCLGETSSAPSEIGNGGADVLYVEGADTDNPVSYTLGTSVGLDIMPTGFDTKTAYDQNHIVHILIPTLKIIRSTFFAMPAYDLLDPDVNPCYDNAAHPDFSSTNLNPCYNYIEAMDNLDPYELPFNAFEDIDLLEFIPEGFLELVSSYMLQSVDGNGEFMGFSAESLEALEALASVAETGSSVLTALDDIAGSDFWEIIAGVIGGQNLLVGLDAFKEEFLAGQIEEFAGITDGIEMLTTLVDNMSHSVPKDKVAFYNQQIRLWEEAVALNEEDKASIIELSAGAQGIDLSQSEQDTTQSSAAQLVVNSPLLVYGGGASVFESASGFSDDPIGPDENLSFSAGNTIQNTQISIQTDVVSHTINYTIEGDIAYEIGGKINGFGGSYNNNIPITFEVEKKVSDTESQGVEVGYVLSDNDESDFISVDVKQSNMGFGPIFRKRGGQTMCPHEGEELFLFYEGEIVSQQQGIFADATQPREVPGIDIEPKVLSNVPEIQQAIFTLSLTNNSAAFQDMVYTLMVDESSNPHGAILLMDGLSVFREIMVPYGQTITKTLTVEKGPVHLNYIAGSEQGDPDNRLGIILRSSCQYNYGTSNTPDIADTIMFGVSFLPGCTPVEISQPVENFVINKLSEDIIDGISSNVVTFELSSYDYNYYSLDNIYLQYKKSNEPVSSFATQQIVKFQKVDEVGESLEEGFDLLLGGSVLIEFDTHDWEDGGYDLRAYTDCQIASEESPVISGHKDTRLPEPFGAPSPADGILEPNDEVSLAWSENIDENKFYSPNTSISVSTVKNSAEVRHDAYVLLDSEDELSIPVGLNLKDKSYTIEMWVNPQQSGILFEQGYDEKLTLSITSDKQLKASYTGTDALEVSSVSSVVFNDWNHVAFVFNNEFKTMSFVINGSLGSPGDIKDFSRDYSGEGGSTLAEAYQGAIHNLRIWASPKSVEFIYANSLNRLSGNEAGLIGYWPMDELEGNPQDLARNRHLNGDVHWAIAQKGKGIDFSSSENVLNAEFGTIAYEQTVDFTIEFWFKTDQVNQTIFSNGSYSAENNIGNLNAWSVGLNDQGNIVVDHGLRNETTKLISSMGSFADNQWHHFALVKNAKANTTLLINGIEQAIIASSQTNGFSSGQLTLGAQSYRNSLYYEYSNQYSGLLDEVRIWNMTRSVSQLSRYRHIRLTGNEIGLHVYYPFEDYQLAAGVAIISAETKDQSGENDLIGSVIYTDDLPLLRMHNPIEGVQFNRIANGDQTLISLTEDLANIEECMVDVSMENVSDLYSNNSQPISWSFFVDKNQLIWDELRIQEEKLLGESMVIETDIINKGGSVEQFEITNLPSWLSATPSEGVLDPNSHTTIELVVNDALFIGDYQEDIMLSGNNEYAERLEFILEVEQTQPQFEINSSDFQYGMNFIGKVSVDEVRSRDDKDILFAYVDQELRGATELVYLDGYDAYFAFLTVNSNSVSGEQVSFRLWDASEGKTQSQVAINSDSTFSVPFSEGSVIGSFEMLANFNASNVLRQEIPLNEGWNWVSFNLNNLKEQDNLDYALQIPTIMNHVDNESVSVFRSQTKYAEYYGSETEGDWYGSMSDVLISEMYMVNINHSDTIVYEGQTVHTDSVPITIYPGWNWISYLGQRSMGINDLLSSLNPESGDLIKSKTAFSMYASESLGWLGTLSTMNSGEGFMMKSANAGTLVYPESSMYSGGSFRMDMNQSPESIWDLDPARYENSMNIIAEIDHPDFLRPHAANVLGAFTENNCLGNIALTPIDGEKYLYFLTVYGQEDYPIHFNYFDSQKQRVYKAENKLSFEANKLFGTIENPYPISIIEESNNSALFDISIYPNPFNEVFDINFKIDESTHLDIQIYDAIGRNIKTIVHENLISGSHQLSIDGHELTKGVYFIEFTLGTESTKKMIVKY